MLLSEHVYCVAVTFKMIEWVEQQIFIEFYVKLEYASAETIRMIQKAVAMGNWWLAASSWQHGHSCITSCAVFGETSNHSGDLFPLQPKIVCDNFCFFPKPKSPLKGKRFQIIEIQKNMMDADGDWENCVRSQGAYFEGDWGIIVLSTMFLVSCVFFNKCLYFPY